MKETLTWIGSALVVAGCLFTLAGAVGMLRFPDFFSRLHPVSVKDSLGIPLIIFGLMLTAGLSLVSLKLFLLLIFLLLTSPTSCHALAKSALLSEQNKSSLHHEPPKKTE